MALKLGKLAKSTETKTGTNYPVAATTPIAAKIVHEFLAAKAKFDAVEGCLKTLKGQLNEMVIQPFFAANAGKAEPVNGVVVRGTEEGESVLVNFIKKYSATSEDSVIEALGKIGKGIVKQFFYEKLSVSINGDKIPAQHQQAILDEIEAIFTKYNCTDAVAAKIVVVPNENFHAARHTVLTEEQNLKLQAVAPCQTQVKAYSK